MGLTDIPEYIKMRKPLTALRSLLSLCVREKKPQDGFQVFKHLEESHISNLKKVGKQLNSLLYLMVETNDKDENVLELFNFLKHSTEANETTYSIMIRFHTLATPSRLTEALKLISEMQQAKIQPHLRSYRPLIEAAPTLDFLREIYEKVKKQDLVPDKVFFEKLFERLAKLESSFATWLPFLQDYKEFHWTISEALAKLLMETFKEKCIQVNETDIHLASIDISAAQRETLVKMIYSKKPPAFDRFNRFVTNRLNDDYDVILDGANIGLYNNSEFSPWKIIGVAQIYLREGKKVLVILNHKRRNIELLTFVSRNSGMYIYWVPSGINDDLIWLYAALRKLPYGEVSVGPRNRGIESSKDFQKLSHGKVSEGPRNRETESSKDLRSSKERVFVVTNDKMSDHIYYTFPNYFKVWVERHQVTYTINSKTEISIKEPLPYSRRIQVHDGIWYLPVEDAKEKLLTICYNI